MAFRSGFVGLVGPSNSGKSTLLNALMGEKLSIVSPKPQTTMRAMRGIVNRPNCQLIFIDTPGMHRRSEPMMRQLNRLANVHARDCDVLLWVFDASKPGVGREFHAMRTQIENLSGKRKPVCLLNKIDKIAKLELLPMIQDFNSSELFSAIIPVSAKKKDGVPEILKVAESELPEGPQAYDVGQDTDRSESFIVSEFVREKIYELTRSELPYSVWVEVEKWESEAGSVPKIWVAIHVDSESRKKILIGKRGNLLKNIGIRARKAVESRLGEKVCLKLYVHVDKEWRNNQQQVKKYLELN